MLLQILSPPVALASMGARLIQGMFNAKVEMRVNFPRFLNQIIFLQIKWNERRTCDSGDTLAEAAGAASTAAQQIYFIHACQQYGNVYTKQYQENYYTQSSRKIKSVKYFTFLNIIGGS